MYESEYSLLTMIYHRSIVNIRSEMCHDGTLPLADSELGPSESEGLAVPS